MKIVLNDWLTDKIPLERGVRQDNPLAPLLYVLCVEFLINLRWLNTVSSTSIWMGR